MEKLNEAKNLLSDVDKKKYHSLNCQLDPFRRFKFIIKKKYNIPHISNAWLKCYEILYTFSQTFFKGKQDFKVFCNAEFPGAFILCIKHYVHTMTDVKHFDWKASSLIGPEDHLEDQYGLMSKYRNNWYRTRVLHQSHFTERMLQKTHFT